jgi:hypothetical protein
MGWVVWGPEEGEEGDASRAVEEDGGGHEGGSGKGDEAEGERIGEGLAGEA